MHIFQAPCFAVVLAHFEGRRGGEQRAACGGQRWPTAQAESATLVRELGVERNESRAVGLHTCFEVLRAKRSSHVKIQVFKIRNMIKNTKCHI
jgi:hypothetical protein